MRYLLNDSGVLVADPSTGRLLALAATIAVLDSYPRLDDDVGPHGRPHGPMAQPTALQKWMDLDSGGSSILRWIAAL
jgi:hypothetical protein